MWKDTEYFKNKGDLHRWAVFLLLQLGEQIQDTEMILVDRTLTDISFQSSVLFTEAGPDFELRLELYGACVEEEGALAGAPKRLATKLSSSLGRSSGRRVRASLDSAGGTGSSPILLPTPAVGGPRYHLLAHTVLTLTAVQDGFRTHDLTLASHEENPAWLPLYGSVCCRLAAQPLCMTQPSASGTLRVQQAGEPQNWARVHGVLKGTNIFCYRRPEDADAGEEPLFTIAINKVTGPLVVRLPGAWAQEPLLQPQEGGCRPQRREHAAGISVLGLLCPSLPDSIPPTLTVDHLPPPAFSFMPSHSAQQEVGQKAPQKPRSSSFHFRLSWPPFSCRRPASGQGSGIRPQAGPSP